MRLTLRILPILAVLFGSSVALAQPATGGPPTAPLKRLEPRRWESSIVADIFATPIDNLGDNKPLRSARSEIIIPILLRGAFSAVDPTSIGVSGQINGDRFREGDVPWKLRGPKPDGSAEIVVEFVDLKAQSIGVTVRFTSQSWRSAIDDSLAMNQTWPTEWPEQVQQYLQPGPFIESADPLFTEFVAEKTNGQLRKVAPYFAAKQLLKETVLAFRSISGTGVERTDFGAISGLQIVGALQAARTEQGSPNDLVCACVAVLRAANIPARPVIGIVKERQKNMRETTRWRTWGEFFLPDSGWVPFDPSTMRGSGFQFKKNDQQWPGLGTMDELNERIPISHRFTDGGVEWQFPPVWDWMDRSDKTLIWRLFSQTSLSRINRGVGTPDP